MTLSAKQRKAISLLVAGRTITATAEETRVSRQTLHRWLDDERFTHELRNEQDHIIDAGLRKLVSLIDKACGALELAMDGAAKSTAVRASDVILSKLLIMRDSMVLTARITELERRLNEQLKRPAQSR